MLCLLHLNARAAAATGIAIAVDFVAAAAIFGMNASIPKGQPKTITNVYGDGRRLNVWRSKREGGVWIHHFRTFGRCPFWASSFSMRRLKATVDAHIAAHHVRPWDRRDGSWHPGA